MKKILDKCGADKCERRASGTGLCWMHEKRFRKNGTLKKRCEWDMEDQISDKASVDKNGCLIWHGATAAGYGQVSVHGDRKLAHRACWEHYYGEIPKGMFVCHKCDNKLCVNIEHLFLGTPKDNTRDMLKKKRHRVASGEAHYMTKIKTEDVVCIRKHKRKDAVRLAEKYSMSKSGILAIMERKNWRHIA